jgi:uncharacterized protein YcbK (DUF882 family)
MQRRVFLIGGAAALAMGPGILQAKTRTAPSHLSLYHTHTCETLDLERSSKGGFSKKAMKQVDHFLRDHRTDEITHIDPRLLNTLFDLTRRAKNPDGVIEIVSGYRSPETNAEMRKKSRGVARKSFHMLGKAVDIRVRGSSTSDLRDVAIAMKRGGVGYYRRSDFIHLDTGQVRHW